MAILHTTRLGVHENVDVTHAGPCGVSTATQFQVATFGPVVTFISAVVSAGTAPPGVAPLVCPTGGSSVLWMVGTPTVRGVYTYTVNALMSDGSHTTFDIVQTITSVTVTSVAPNHGLSIGGTAVTITGTLFEAGSTVEFDNVAATSVVFVNATTITCVTPAHAVGAVNVTVTLPSGEFGTLANGYTYDVSGPTGMAPNNGPMAGGTLVTITGNSFQAGMSITFDGIAATSITFVNSGQYTCITPEHAAGPVEVLMTGGSHGTFDAGVYTYNPVGGAVWPSGGFSTAGPRRNPEIVINRTKGVPSSSAFDLNGDVTPPTAGQKIDLDLSEGSVFKGIAVSVATTYDEIPSQVKRTVTPTDYNWLLNARRPFGAWVDTSATTIVQEIMDGFAPDFTYAGLQAVLPNVSIVLDGSQNVADALTAVLTAMNVGGSWYLEVQDLHFFETESGVNPVEIVDDLDTFLKDPPIQITEDVTQVRNRVFGEGQGSTVAAAAAPGSNILEVASLAPFGASGGYAIVNGRVISYTGLATVSEAIFRSTAPGGSGFDVAAKIIAGLVVEGNIRDIPFYKVSSLDAAGNESALSAVSAYIGAPPQVGVGTGSVAGSATAGFIGAGSYSYRFADVTLAGTEAPALLFGVSGSTAYDLNAGAPWASDPRVVAVNVYRTKAGQAASNSSTQWFRICTLTSGSPTFTDKLNDDSLSGANPNMAFPYVNTTGVIAELANIPLGAAGTVSRKIYRATYRNPDVYKLLTTIADNTTTAYEDNTATPSPNLLDQTSPSVPVIAGGDGPPGGLPPVIHLMLTGIPTSGAFSINKSIPVDVAVNIWTQVDDLAAQRDLADRLGGDGVREFTVVDTSLNAANLASRVQAELTLWANPITTVTWATLDPLTIEGRTQAFALSHPPLSGSFLIQTVKVDQLHVTDGRDPRRVATASSVRFTLDDLFHKLLQNTTSGGSGGGGGAVPAANVGGAGSSGLDTSAVVDGDLLIGRLSDRTVNPAQVTAGVGIAVTPGPSALTIASTAVLPNGTVPFTGDQSMGSHKLTNVTDPASAQDAATKAYVDAVATGLNFKQAVRVATGANITLSGTQTIDGVAVIAGDRVLVKNQTTGANNGIYVCAAGAWARATDADTSAEVTAGMFCFVNEGTVNGDQGWVLTTNNPITLGTTALVFAQMSGGGATGTTVNASAYRATNQTLTHNTEAALSFSNVDFDTSVMWAVGNPTRLTVPSSGDGVYLVRGTVKFATGFKGAVHLRIYKNGTLVTEESSQSIDTATDEFHQVSSFLSLVATDFVEVKALIELAAGSGTYDAVGGTGNTFMQAARMAAQSAGGAHALLDGSQDSDTTAAAPAKGALIVGSASKWEKVAVGSDGLTVIADSSQSNGVRWGAAGALVLLEEHIASASASLDFTTRNVLGQSGATFQSDYDEYVLRIDSLVPATNATALLLRMSTNGGSTFDATSGNYSWASLAMAFNATGSNGSTSATAITLINDCANAAKLSQSGDFNLTGLLSTSLYKLIRGMLNQTDSTRTTASLATVMAGKYLVDATAVNACRILMSSGNITSGKARIYGVAK